jgi:hypothetical protein
MGWGTMATGAFVGAANRGYQDQRDRDLGYERAKRGLEWEQQDRDFAMEQRPMQRELQQMQFEDAKYESHRKALERDFDKILQTFFLKGRDPQVFGDAATHYFPNGVTYKTSRVADETGKPLIRFEGDDGSVMDYVDEKSMFDDFSKFLIPGAMRKAIENEAKSNADYRGKMLEHRLDLDKERYKTGLSVQAENAKLTTEQKNVADLTRDLPPDTPQDSRWLLYSVTKDDTEGKNYRAGADIASKVYLKADELYPGEPQKAKEVADRTMTYVNKTASTIGQKFQTPPGRGDSITVQTASGKAVELKEGSKFSEGGKPYMVIKNPETKTLEKAAVVQEAGKTYAVVQGRDGRGAKKFELKSNAPAGAQTGAPNTPAATPEPNAQGSRNFDANGNLNLPAPVAQQPQQFRPWLQGASSASPIMAEDFGVDMPGAYNRPQAAPYGVVPANNAGYVPPVVLPSDYDLPRRAQGGPVQAGLPYLTGEEGTETFTPSQNNANASTFSNTTLPAEEEAKFQQWVRALPWHSEFVQQYGSEPDLDTKDYDYRGAWKAGIEPQRYKHDQNRYHWSSQFKSPEHPTMWMEHYMRSTGVDPSEVMRNPSDTELEYFRANPHVGGMADFNSGSILINPHSKLSAKEKASVALNETARLVMRKHNLAPNFQLTPQQQQAFAQYGNGDELAKKETIIGRIISGDPSALDVTPEQKAFAEKVKMYLMPKRAQGGPVMAGLPYLTGEEGTEEFIPSNAYPNPYGPQGGRSAGVVPYYPEGGLQDPLDDVVANAVRRPVPAAPMPYATGRPMEGGAVRGQVPSVNDPYTPDGMVRRPVDISALNEPVPNFPRTYGQSPVPNYPVRGQVDMSALNEPVEQPAPIRGQSPIRKVTYPGGHTGRGTDDPNALPFSNLPIDVRSLAIKQIIKGERTFTPKFDEFVKQEVMNAGGNMARAAKSIGDKMSAGEVSVLNVPEQAIMDITGGINQTGNGVSRSGTSTGAQGQRRTGPSDGALPFMQALRRFSPEAFDGQYSAMGGDPADVGGGASIPMRRKTITDAQKAEANMQNAEAAANKAEATIKNNPVKGQGSQQAQKVSAKGPEGQSTQKTKPSRRERQRRREAERRKLAEGQSQAEAAEAVPVQTGLPEEPIMDQAAPSSEAALSPYGKESARRPYDPVQLVIGDRAGEATNRGPIRPIPMSERDYTTRN